MRIRIKMQAVSNFFTASSAQNLNALVEKTNKTEENADSTAMVTSKTFVTNLHKTTMELFSGELIFFY